MPAAVAPDCDDINRLYRRHGSVGALHGRRGGSALGDRYHGLCRDAGVTLFGLFLTPVFYVALRKLSGRPLVQHGESTFVAIRSEFGRIPTSFGRVTLLCM